MSKDRQTLRKPYRVVLCVVLVGVVLLGFASKPYQGLEAGWVNNYAGGFLYEVFWILLITLIWPQVSSGWLAWNVLLVTVALEFL